MEQNSLTKLSLAGQVGVSMLLVALICGGFYYLWYSDALEQENSKRTELEILRRDILALEVVGSKLPAFQREVQLLEAKIKTLKGILPPERETPARQGGRPHANLPEREPMLPAPVRKESRERAGDRPG
jgi:Tfp pilus assembly protein PilO